MQGLSRQRVYRPGDVATQLSNQTRHNSTPLSSSSYNSPSHCGCQVMPSNQSSLAKPAKLHVGRLGRPHRCSDAKVRGESYWESYWEKRPRQGLLPAEHTAVQTGQARAEAELSPGVSLSEAVNFCGVLISKHTETHPWLPRQPGGPSSTPLARPACRTGW